jgi:hypothetical protein
MLYCCSGSESDSGKSDSLLPAAARRVQRPATVKRSSLVDAAAGLEPAAPCQCLSLPATPLRRCPACGASAGWHGHSRRLSHGERRAGGACGVCRCGAVTVTRRAAPPARLWRRRRVGPSHIRVCLPQFAARLLTQAQPSELRSRATKVELAAANTRSGACFAGAPMPLLRRHRPPHPGS